MQTSTITVVVLREPEPAQVQLHERDLEWSTCRGSGAGGQHRNKTESAVQLRHLPTGLMVRCESERSQKQNKDSALAALRAKLWDLQERASQERLVQNRRAQHGSGMRGDKRRTIRAQEDLVTDHITGKKMPLSRYLKGFLEDLK